MKLLRANLADEPLREQPRLTLSRVLGAGEDPLQWGVPIRVGRLRARVHVLFLLWIIAEAIVAAFTSGPAWMHAAFAAGTLFIVVVAREWVVQSLAEDVKGCCERESVLWPLGMLAAAGNASPARTGYLVGLATGAGFCAAFALASVRLGASLSDLVNPFRVPDVVCAGPVSTVMWPAAVWWMYVASVSVTLFNAVIPTVPSDAARVVQASMTARHGQLKGREMAGRISLLISVLLLSVGAAMENGRVMGVACIAIMATIVEVRRGTLPTLAPDTSEAERLEPSSGGAVRHPASSESVPNLDQLLARVSKVGIHGLTPDELGALRAETSRRRARTGRSPQRFSSC